jgi:hypothetical protein
MNPDREGGEQVKARKPKLKYSYQKYDDETWLLIEDQCVQFATCQTEDRAKFLIDRLNNKAPDETLVEKANFLREHGETIQVYLGTIRSDLFPHDSQVRFNNLRSDLRALLTRQPK